MAIPPEQCGTGRSAEALIRRRAIVCGQISSKHKLGANGPSAQ
jgi:hypothetical protein